MTDALPFEQVVRIALTEASEIIRDGAADELTTADLATALAVLDGGSRKPEDVEKLAQVVALGAEYLATVEREDDVVHQLGQNPESAVRYWYITAGQ